MHLNSTTGTVRVNSLKAWILGIRPKTLVASTVPVLLGCSLAYADGGFQWTPALLCLSFGLLMQIDANLINDLYDYLKGCDREDRLGPERVFAQGWITLRAMKTGIALVTLLACLCGLGLLFYGGLWLIAVGAVCVLFAFLYTAGPYPLAYHGFGDLLVILFFGIVPVGLTYYVMCSTWTTSVTRVALACGLVIDTLLMINNYRDREQDAHSGKRTIVVYLGGRAGSILYLALGVAAVALCLPFARSGQQWAAILPLFYLIPHTLSWRKMVRIGQGKALNRILGETARNMLLFGLLLSAGFILSAL